MECSIKRQDLVNVATNCPERPYLELELPADVQTIRAVRFSITSHDQGWCDLAQNAPPYDHSFTFFTAYAKRTHGQRDPQQERVQTNRRGDGEFHTHTIRWSDQDAEASKSKWVKSLRAGDTVQLIPRAHYPGWVNIIKEAEIHIHYEPRNGKPRSPLSHVMQPGYNEDWQYQPLDGESGEIRLLVIHPGAFDDQAVCSLVHTPLAGGNQREFEAFSYCWGDATDRTSISLCHSEHDATTGIKQFSISRSAETAIRYLRHADGQSRAIWIDAVCINQSDFQERAQQVSMMAKIYSKAKQVNIWLGEGDAESKLAIQIIRETFNSQNRICPGADGCRCSGTPHKLRPDEHEMSRRGFDRIHRIFGLITDRSSSEQELYHVMTALFGNPWFRRVWVFQEALSCPNAIMHCGYDRLPFQELIEVNAYLGSIDNHFKSFHLAPQAVVPPLWASLIRAQQLRTEESASLLSYNNEPGILDVFLSALELEASDPRDKLFALLSFGNETKSPSLLPPAIRPNYEKPATDVFADFTRWWIVKHKSLHILSAIHGQTGRTWQSLHWPLAPPKPPRRPTWAIGSEGHSRWAKATLQARFGHRASGNTTVDTTLLQRRRNPHSISLLGFRVAEIKQMTYFPLDQLHFEMPGLVDAFLAIFDPSSASVSWISAMNESMVRRGTVEEARVTTGHFFDHLTGHWRYGPTRKLEVVDIKKGPGGDGRFGVKESAATLPCAGRCFFVASDGRAGLCPAGAREGDVVVVLFGGDVPFLVRSVSGDDEHAQFEFVGECYLEGVMDGEYIEEQREKRGVPEVFSIA